MGRILIIAYMLIIGTGDILGQEYSLYSNDVLSIESEYLQETIQLNIHLPETQPYSASTTTYPITIIFDSQHDRTYPQIVRAFDLLTSETQVPETIIVGVPFTIRNRLYFTSNQKRENDPLSGIERMELFLFHELIPRIQNEFNGNAFISLVGHSRTGFLVNYLAFKRSNQINVAASLSGFFNDDPLTIEQFHAFLINPENFQHPFNYYFTAGTSLEESTYLTQLHRLKDLLEDDTIPENVNLFLDINSNANHITNYWVSVPSIAIDVFADYNAILDNWFHGGRPTEDLIDPVQTFASDLIQAGHAIGLNLNPNLTHIYSLASYYINSHEDYQTAIRFFEYGLYFYPEFVDLYVTIIVYAHAMEDVEKATYYRNRLREVTISSVQLSDFEKNAILDYLSEH